MSGGILRFPWTSQPQTPVGIDWNNPLTRELLFSTSLAAGTGYKSQGKDGRIGTVNTKVDTGVTRYGTAAKFDGTGYLDFGTTPIIGSTTPITITLYEETAATAGTPGILSFPVGSQNFLWIRGTTATYECAVGPSNSGGATTNFNSLGAQVAGEKIRFVLRNVSGASSITGWELWANGVKQTNNTTFFGSTAAASVKVGWDGFDAKFNGLIADVNIIGRAWSDAEVKEYFSNPYQIHQPIQRTIWVPAAGGGVSGTLATTNANDTSAASGTTTVTGTLAKTNANDSSSASGTTTVTGTLATTNANDSVTASGDVGGNITGTVNYTNANDTSAASGTTTVTGSLAKTNANDSVSASGTTTVTGSLARTNANDSVVASGAAGTVTGTVNVTNSNDTADAYGIGAPNNDSGDGSMSRKRYYLRRKGKILLFDTAAQADDYLEAEEEAQKAIATAKSRGAKKRIAAKILKAVEPVESVEIAPLQEMVKAYSVPVDLPTLLKQNDYSQVMKVREMIQRMLDDEDDELLLLLA